MKKAFVVLILCCATAASAQVSKAMAEKAYDYVTVKIINQYLLNYFSDSNKIREYDYELKKSNYFGKLKPMFDSVDINHSIPIHTLSNLLTSNNFNKTAEFFLKKQDSLNLQNDQMPREVANNIVNRVFLKLLRTNREKNENGNFKSDLVNQVSAFLRTSERIEPTQPATKYYSPENESQILNNNKFIISLAISVLLFFALFFLIFFRPLKRQLSFILSDLENVSKKSINSENQRNINISKDIENLKHEIGLLKTELGSYKDKSSDFGKVETPTLTSEKTNTAIVEQFFFMGAPYNNLFPISYKATDYIPGKVLYKFFQISSDRAFFEFISDEESIKFIRNNSLEVIRTACKFENQPNVHSNKVATLVKGEVICREDSWIIIKKAIIRFDNPGQDENTIIDNGKNEQQSSLSGKINIASVDLNETKKTAISNVINSLLVNPTILDGEINSKEIKNKPKGVIDYKTNTAKRSKPKIENEEIKGSKIVITHSPKSSNKTENRTKSKIDTINSQNKNTNSETKKANTETPKVKYSIALKNNNNLIYSQNKQIDTHKAVRQKIIK